MICLMPRRLHRFKDIRRIHSSQTLTLYTSLPTSQYVLVSSGQFKCFNRCKKIINLNVLRPYLMKLVVRPILDMSEASILTRISHCNSPPFMKSTTLHFPCEVFNRLCLNKASAAYCHLLDPIFSNSDLGTDSNVEIFVT